MEDKLGPTQLSLSEKEISSIDDYRRKKNTAVLTIMFTDIQGFTSLAEENGESYVHELHQSHDRILVETIEEGNAGVVIKYIGDSIMAVFSEPTAAAEKALLIQSRLKAFNQDHPELDKLMVRIGLHMGQTVIENKMQTDLFGRHVNKASRVESLAAGGHIYITYTVFDSIKSWLMDSKGAAWKLHGSYYLKGISKAEEIYEIYDTAITQAQAPRKARKKNRGLVLAGLGGVGILLLAGALALGLGGSAKRARGLEAGSQAPAAIAAEAPATQTGPATTTENSAAKAGQPGQATAAGLKATAANVTSATAKTTVPAAPAPQAAPGATPPGPPPEVYFLGMIAREPILDFTTPLAVSLVDPAQGLKKSINDIEPGKHVLHFVRSYMVRFYSVFEVKPGKNIVQINFKESYLPGVDIYYNIGDGPEPSPPEAHSDEEAYFFIDRKSLSRIDHVGKPGVEIQGRKTADGKVVYEVHYTLVLDKATIVDKTMRLECPASQAERIEVKNQALHEDDYHRYTLSYGYDGRSLHFDISAAFKD